jgi:Protein of unknown function (DUF2555)
MSTETSVKDIASLTAADIEIIAARLEDDNYASPFDGLDDWHLLRAVAFQQPELVEPYIHLLDVEAYDES